MKARRSRKSNGASRSVAHLPWAVGIDRAHRRQDRHRALRPRRADRALILGLVEIDGGDRVAGEFGPDPAFGVAEPDERPQQVRGLRQIGRVGDELARDPVVQDDLDRHRAPAQRIAGPVVGAEPDHRLEQPAVVGVVERRPER